MALFRNASKACGQLRCNLSLCNDCKSWFPSKLGKCINCDALLCEDCVTFIEGEEATWMCAACRRILIRSRTREESKAESSRVRSCPEVGPVFCPGKGSSKGCWILAKGGASGSKELPKTAAAAAKSEARMVKQREKRGKKADEQRSLRGQPKIHVGSGFAQERAAIRELAKLNERRLNPVRQGFVCKETAQRKCIVKAESRPWVDPVFPLKFYPRLPPQ